MSKPNEEDLSADTTNMNACGDDVDDRAPVRQGHVSVSPSTPFEVACEPFASQLCLLSALTQGRFASSLCLCLCLCHCLCLCLCLCLCPSVSLSVSLSVVFGVRCSVLGLRSSVGGGCGGSWLVAGGWWLLVVGGGGADDVPHTRLSMRVHRAAN